MWPVCEGSFRPKTGILKTRLFSPKTPTALLQILA
jgi:hypothetical protein